MPLMRESITHSGRVRVRHHSWDSGKHRCPRHDALLPAHSWSGTRETELEQVHRLLLWDMGLKKLGTRWYQLRWKSIYRSKHSTALLWWWFVEAHLMLHSYWFDKKTSVMAARSSVTLRVLSFWISDTSVKKFCPSLSLVTRPRQCESLNVSHSVKKEESNVLYPLIHFSYGTSQNHTVSTCYWIQDFYLTCLVHDKLFPYKLLERNVKCEAIIDKYF